MLFLLYTYIQLGQRSEYCIQVYNSVYNTVYSAVCSTKNLKQSCIQCCNFFTVLYTVQYTVLHIVLYNNFAYSIYYPRPVMGLCHIRLVPFPKKRKVWNDKIDFQSINKSMNID